MTTRLPNVHPSDTTKWPQSNGTFDIGAANEGSKILMYNETPLNLQLDFLNGSTDTLHAWEANFWPLDGDTKQVQWQIDADSLNVSAPPINAVFLTLYGSNEPIHGQYPMALVRQASVGNPEGVSTTATSTLSNENSAPTPVLVIDIGNTSHAQLITIYNDGSFSFSVNISGTNHTLMQGTLAHLLQLGMLNDATEILGNLKVDGTSSLDNAGILTDGVGNITTIGKILSWIFGTKTLGVTVAGDVIDASGDTTYIKSRNAGGVYLQTPSGTNAIRVDGVGQIGVAASGDTLDASSTTGLYIKTRSAPGNINFQIPNGTTVVDFSSSGDISCHGGGINYNIGRIKDWNYFTGTGSGTYNHGLSGTPIWVAAITDVSGSATQGFDSGNATTVHITLGASNAFKAAATR